MTRLSAILILLAVGGLETIRPVAAQQNAEKQGRAQGGIFTGIHRNRAGWRGSETVTITDGKSYIRLTEQEYRAGGYWPPYERLPTVVVERLPVRIPAPSEEELRQR
jgi:hypothetical protein